MFWQGDIHKTYDYRINNTNIDLRHGISVTATDVAPGKTSLVVRRRGEKAVLAAYSNG